MEASHQEPIGPHSLEPRLEPRLGLWDAVSLIVGIIIGVGIFEIPVTIFADVPTALDALLVWALGGALVFLGALCFAELASTYPRSGGEYVYLTRAFGPLAGYLFAWAQLTVIRPASIGAMAYVFATYAHHLLGAKFDSVLFFAVLSVIVLTGINVLGVTLGTRIQNVLTVLKILGLGAIMVVGLGWGQSRWHESTVTFPANEHWLAVTMIPILWVYSGWHEGGYVAAEVKNPRRNLPLALFLATIAVTAIYLAINLAFWLALGFEEARDLTNKTPLPVRVLELAWGRDAGSALSVLIIVSALGAINGMVFTTARINAAFGADHRLFTPLSKWSERLRTPARALIAEGVITVAMILGVGFTVKARGLDAMIDVTAAVFWFFFLLTGLALFVLRKKDADLHRPFRVPAYPLVPMVFCLWCGGMVFASILRNQWLSLIGVGILLAGLPFYFVPRKKRLGLPTDIGSAEVAAV